MAEATREFAIAKTMEILRAYVRKIEDARGYFDCLSPEGRRIVENYDNNVDGQKTLLLKASDNKDFFLGMPDDMVLAYADVCRKMNDRFDLNVKKVYPIEKITADMSSLENMIPQKYYERAQNSISNMPEKQRQEVMEFIGKLYKENRNPQKTMQEHHWIEQSRIKNTEKYPFLSCPPMKEDLLKSKSNLSLIVGHNGGHKKTYNNLLDKKLEIIMQNLKQQCMKQNISLEALMQNNNAKLWINKEIEKAITELQDAVKKDYTILNNVEKMFILD